MGGRDRADKISRVDVSLLIYPLVGTDFLVDRGRGGKILKYIHPDIQHFNFLNLREIVLLRDDEKLSAGKDPLVWNSVLCTSISIYAYY